MPQIDVLLASMTKFGAQAAQLVSNEKVQLAFPTGKRYASQTTPHASLVALVEEIVPPGVTLNRNGGTTFLYHYDGMAVTVRVDAAMDAWKVAIEPKPAAPELTETSAPVRPTGISLVPTATPGPAAPAPPKVPKSYSHLTVHTAIERLLLKMLEMGASDLHLGSGVDPFVRLHGIMQPLQGQG